jgi:hypothetical protein
MAEREKLADDTPATVQNMAGKRRKTGSRSDQDSPWKETLQHFLQAVLEFFFPRLHEAIDWSKGYESLDKEFQQIVGDARAGRSLADKLFKVWRRDGREQWLLIHVEVQGRVERRFGKRMFRYNIRCFELYDRRVVSLAILCDENKDWRPTGFIYGGWGSRTGIRFPVVKLIDYVGKETELATSASPIAQVVLAQLEALATRGELENRRSTKLRLVKNLYDRAWSAADVRQLFRIIDWLMDLPPELQDGFRKELHEFEEERRMPYVTSIERLAREEGRQEGREEGAREELLATIQTTLEDKFGAAALYLMTKVRNIADLPRLRALNREIVKTDSLQTLHDSLEDTKEK